jgi:type I restriction enzyme R subunit
MATESKVQRKLIDDIFVGKLGYKEKKASCVDMSLIIPSDVELFLKTPVNIDSYQQLLKQYQGDSQLLLKDFCLQLKTHIFHSHNVAIRLAKQKGVLKYKELEFTLWNKAGSPINDNSSDNIFTVVEEIVYKPETDNQNEQLKTYWKRLDLCFFINGIFFSYMELKHNFTNQDVHKGTGKVITDYMDAIAKFSLEDSKDRSILSQQNQALKLFERSIHIASSDVHRTHIIRNIKSYRNKFRTAIKSQNNSIAFENNNPKFREDFSEYPHSCKQKDNAIVKALDVFTSLYSKQSIYNEILYYNYLDADRNGTNYTLISPRPKQKFGVDKTMQRVNELYLGEQNPQFIEDEFRQKLKRLDFNQSDEDFEVASRMKLNNNTGIYSIIKQYAAGFGKTKLMSWEALQLSEANHPLDPKNKLFNKVILLSDRLDLKQQMANTMRYMPNIERNAWDEAITVDEFLALLSNPIKRIIVVNIQKFNHIHAKLNKREVHNISKLRVAFIVDEIHRSNNGDQNELMQDLFTHINNVSSDKKNLLIGLTATASDPILRRFGEIDSISSKGLNFKAFDNYTMLEAIKGGYVLDPTKGFIPVTIPYFIGDADDQVKYKDFASKDLYQCEDYIKAVVSHAYKIFNQVTFNKINKSGKAMYVADSIDAAISAFNFFKVLIDAEDHPEDKAPDLFIAYSDSGGEQVHRASSKALNNGLSESQVIHAFKANKPGIIIVVEKLQTGFDEPRLHTLVLNTERKDITMVQTLCRVNRTMPNKKDCLVVDYSVTDPVTGKNKNELNAKEAFDKYAGINMTSFHIGSREAQLKKNYNNIKKNTTFINLFDNYKRSRDNVEQDLGVFTPQVLSLGDNEIKTLMALARDYFKELTLISGVVDLDKKYLNQQLPDFFRRIRSILNADSERKLPLPIEVSELSGIILLDDIEGTLIDVNEIMNKPKMKDTPENSDERLKGALDSINEFNEITEEYLSELNGLIKDIFNYMNFENKALMHVNYQGDCKVLHTTIKSSPYEDHSEQFLKTFKKVFKILKRKQLKSELADHVDDIPKMIKFLPEFFYQEYICQLKK